MTRASDATNLPALRRYRAGDLVNVVHCFEPSVRETGSPHHAPGQTRRGIGHDQDD
jgi:hypothetical protein